MLLRLTVFALLSLSPNMLLCAAEQARPTRELADGAGKISALAFSPNGKFLASAGEDRMVRIWDVATGELLHTLEGHRGEVLSLAFRPDNYLLASAGRNDKAGEVRIWTRSSGRLFKLYDYPSPVISVAYGPKNAFAVACGNGTVQHRYTCTGNVLAEQRPVEWAVRFVGFRPDNSLVASDGGNEPTLWNVTESVTIAKFESHSYLATCIALTPDGKTLATCGVNQLKLWDADSGKLKFAPQGIHGHTYGMAFTPDGSTLITGGNNCHAREDNGQQDVELNLWDVASGKRRGYFAGELPEIASLAMSPDGKTLATGDWKDGKIYIWNVAGAKQVKE